MMKTIYFRLMKSCLLFAAAAPLLLAIPCYAQSANCTPPPQDLIAWWRGEGNVADAAGTNNGVLKGGAGFDLGEIGAAFALNGSTAYVEVPDSDLWAFGANSFSIELWVNFRGLNPSSSVSQPAAIFVGNDEGPGTVNKWFFSLGAGRLCFHLYSHAAGAKFLVQAPFSPALNQWYHLAVVREGNIFTVYRNGVAIGFETNTVVVPNASAPLTIGQAEGLGYVDGRIDELSMYGRALKASELQAIYNAGSEGKCAPPVPPVILTQPQSQAAFVGAIVTISVVAGGSKPLSLQWRLNGTNLAEGTTSSLTLTNVQPGNAGNYSVVVTNLAGSVVSSNAVLAVLPPGACIAPPDGIVGWWRAEGNVADTAGTNNGVLRANGSFETGEAGAAFSLNGSTAYVEVPDSDLWAFGTKPFSIELWVNFRGLNPSSSISRPAAIFVGNDEGPGTVNKWFFSLGGGRLCFVLYSQAAGAKSLVQAPFSPALNQWYHLAVVRDGSAFTAYSNGVAIGSENDAVVIPNPNAPLTIGQAEGIGYLDGLIDEVTIYGRALLATEFQAIHNVGTAGKCFPVLNDGIPGSWRQQYFGPEYANDPRVPAIADPDGDGANNYQEFMAGTNPLDSQSFVLISLLGIAPSERFFTNSVNVALVSPVINGVIRYSMDNSAPSITSAIYQTAIRLYEMTTIKAQVFVNGFPVSDVVTATFTRIYALNDGIPDSWREQYFGPNFRTDPRVASRADPDGDGSDNAHEYVAGTHPLDPASRLAAAIRFLPLITWDSLTNKSYRVVRRDSIRATNSIALTPFIRATNTVSSFIDFDAASLNAFYLIEIEP